MYVDAEQRRIEQPPIANSGWWGTLIGLAVMLATLAYLSRWDFVSRLMVIPFVGVVAFSAAGYFTRRTSLTVGRDVVLLDTGTVFRRRIVRSAPADFGIAKVVRGDYDDLPRLELQFGQKRISVFTSQNADFIDLASATLLRWMQDAPRQAAPAFADARKPDILKRHGFQEETVWSYGNVALVAATVVVVSMAYLFVPLWMP